MPTYALQPFREVRHNQRERTSTQSLDELGMLGIEITCALDNRGILLLRMRGELLYSFGRYLLGLLGRDSSTMEKTRELLKQTASKSWSGGAEQLTQYAGALLSIGLAEELAEHLRKRRSLV